MATKRSKRYNKALEGVDLEKQYSLKEALKLLAQMPSTKFDETVELSGRLGVDPKQGDQMVRGMVSLPHGSGKKVKIAVFTENPKEAKDAGADHAGLNDLIEKIEKESWMDFDVAIATPTAMKELRKVARVLGPRGLMPNPKSGTVTDNIPEGIEQVKAGRVEFKMDKTANIAVIVGKKSFKEEKLEENTNKAIEAINSARPESFKGIYLKSLNLSSSMSPGVRLNLKELNA